MVSATQILIDGRPTTVWLGGRGEPLLLVHGAWGGAPIHWAPVWDRLAERFQVVAPDLPGLTEGTERGPRTFQEWARWLDQLFDAVEVSGAWCVGNSFGAAVVWRFAALAPARCRGIVLVNGTPPPQMPGAVRHLFERPPLRQLLTAMLRWNAFSRSTLDRAFADPSRAPQALRRVIAQPSPPQLELVRDIMLRDDACSSSRPQVPVLLAWGEADRLMGASPRAARRLHQSLPGSQLTFIPGAGHLPQVERPAAFADALFAFIRPAHGSDDAA